MFLIVLDGVLRVFAVFAVGLVVEKAEKGEAFLQKAHAVALVIAGKALGQRFRLRGKHRRLRGGVRCAGNRQSVEILKGGNGLRGLLAIDAVHTAAQVSEVGKALLKALDLIPPRALGKFLRQGRQAGKCKHKYQKKRHRSPQ